jgi:DNA polymerase-1
MIDVILAGGDLHQLTVDLLAERGIEITRDTAKMTNFLIVYGGGGKALHEQAGIPLDLAYEIVTQQRDAYPSIAMYSKLLGMERDAIRTISNRRLPVTRNRKTGDIRAYANVNYAVQSAAREVLVDAWMRLESGHTRPGRPGIVWLPVHDELVLQVPTEQLVDVIADAEAAMTMDFRGVPVTATAVPLIDEHGVSRWMTGKHSEAIAKQKQGAAA